VWRVLRHQTWEDKEKQSQKSEDVMRISTMNPIAYVIGSLAALLSTVAMTPQVIKIHKTKNTRDLSLMAFVVLSCAIFLWFIYGLLIMALPVIIGNTLGFILTIYIVIMKIKYG